MVFKWLKRRRINELAAAGAVVTASALERGEAPRPTRLVRTQLGYGYEIWADYGEVTRFRQTPRMIENGKLVTDVDDAAALASTLRVPLVVAGVRF
jgi:hypothetical protein